MSTPTVAPNSKGRTLVAWIDRIVLHAFWLLPLWLLLLRFEKLPLLPQPEFSWVATMTQAVAERWQFGRDFIFTYGPLAPLTLSTYSAKIYTFFFVAELLFKAGYVGLVFWLSQRLPPARRVLYILTTAFVGLMSWQVYDTGAIAAAALVLVSSSRSARWLVAPALALVTALALVKATFLFFALFMLATVSCRLLLNKRWRGALLVDGGFALCFCGGWWLLGQNLANLPGYLRGSIEISGGYTQAMSVPAERVVLILAALTVVVLLVQLLTLLWHGRAHWRANGPMFALLCFGMLIAWKQGFVRADDHVIDWLLYAMASVVAAPLFFESDRPLGGASYSVSVFLVFALSLGAIHRQNPRRLGEALSDAPGVMRRSVYGVFHPRANAVVAKQGVLQLRTTYALKRIRGVVGEEPVDAFGLEQAVIVLNSFNYRPRPSFEGYSTYTPYLAALNEAYYRSDRAPRYVIYKLQTIDNRVPSQDDAGLILALTHNYRPILSESGYLLLERRDTPAAHPSPASLPLVASGEITAGQTLPLPTDAPLWGELEVRETLLGKLLNFVYQTPPVFIQLSYSHGAPVTHRLIPATAKDGFLVSPMLETEHDFLQFAAGDPLDPVSALSVTGDGWRTGLFQPRIAYRFLKMPPPDPAAREAALQTLRDFNSYDDVFAAQPTAVHSSTAVQRVLLDNRPFLLVHVVGEVDFDIPSPAHSISGSFAIRPEAWHEGHTDGVEFRVEYVGPGQAPVSLFDRFLNPAAAPETDGILQSFKVDLPPDARGQIILRTLPGPAGNASWDWACWSGVQFQ